LIEIIRSSLFKFNKQLRKSAITIGSLKAMRKEKSVAGFKITIGSDMDENRKCEES
jgi:hypothetical protein